MINENLILETINMIKLYNLDIRTVTLAISLRDCMDRDVDVVCENIYNKITRYAKNLVEYAKELENDYSIPIINKRISVTPISLVGEACKNPDYVKIAETLDKAAKDVGVNFIGGFSALVEKGCTKGDKLLIESIPQALAKTERLCSSINVASSKAGINMDAVLKMAETIKKTAELTKDKDCLGAAKLVVFCNSPGDNPFMAGAFCGIGEPECALNVGVSGPGVVRAAIEALGKDANLSELANKIKQIAYKITTTGELVGRKLAQRLEIPFGVIDLSLAPTPDEGDSVAGIFQAMGLEHAGAHGTTAALAMLNDAVKKGGIMASSHVGGLSGAFIPVSEDAGMIEAAEKGYLTFDKLEAMTSVCSVGLDMIAIPGDTPVDTIAGMIADEMAIGMINKKTTAVRLIPVLGKKIGEEVVFGGLLGKAPIMPVNTLSSTGFVRRGGRIPAPIHSLNN
ncbi:MAG: PFL family protein [Candidatus Melainabacteria bacterium 35_41]|nr:MAG: PFL family protein [Candidatus Melainabacteria bacterium 35_41]